MKDPARKQDWVLLYSGCIWVKAAFYTSIPTLRSRRLIALLRREPRTVVLRAGALRIATFRVVDVRFVRPFAGARVVFRPRVDRVLGLRDVAARPLLLRVAVFLVAAFLGVAVFLVPVRLAALRVVVLRVV